jgi:hypothetical protein
LEVGAERGFKLDLRQDCDPGKWKLKGAVRTKTYWHHYCQHWPIVLGLCCLQPSVFEDFYAYLVLTVLTIYVLGWFPFTMTLVQCWYAFVKHP